MKKFESVFDYDEYLRDEFDEDSGLSECEIDDFCEFVLGKDFEILRVCDELEVDEDVLIMDGKWYWIVERYEGMRFCEVDDEDIEYIKNNMK